LIAFLAVLVYVVFFSQYLQVDNVEISGNSEIESLEIRKVFDEKVIGSFMGIVPRNNFLLISKSGVESLLKEKFRNISSVTVTKRFPNSIRIEISERKGLLVWCEKEDKCFLIDENGFAYDQADFGSQEISQNHLLKITDKSAREVSLGDDVLTPDYVKYVLNIKESLTKLGFELSEEYSTPSRMSNEIDVKTKGLTEIFFSTQYELDRAVKTLEIVLKKELESVGKEKIAYIDLRTQNKVFYKLGTESDSDKKDDQKDTEE
jgi:cell division septal protein FtsQ